MLKIYPLRKTQPLSNPRDTGNGRRRVEKRARAGSRPYAARPLFHNCVGVNCNKSLECGCASSIHFVLRCVMAEYEDLDEATLQQMVNE